MTNESEDRYRLILSHCRALQDSMQASVASDPDSVWKFNGYKAFVHKYNELATATCKHAGEAEFVDLFDIEKMPGPMDSIAHQQKVMFDQVAFSLSILISFIENKLNLRQSEIQSLADFFQTRIRSAVFDKPTREKEIQNVVEQLMIGRGWTKGVEYDRESGRVKVSIKETIPDFNVDHLNLAIEVKLSKTKEKSKEIVDEINADIQGYGKKYDRMIFIVYDLGTIRDESEFKQDLECTEKIAVLVIKH